jgi:hypothetical protein
MWMPRSLVLSLLKARDTDRTSEHMLPTELRPFACSRVNPRALMMDGAYVFMGAIITMDSSAATRWPYSRQSMNVCTM